MQLPRLEQEELRGKRVFLRVDFNVPLENGKVTDKTRIEKTLPTIELLIKKGAKIVIGSHLGRPKGKPDPQFSMEPVFEVFQGLVSVPVFFSKDVVGEQANQLSKQLKEGEILVLENLRFHKEEEENEAGFCKKLASLADVYVNDAFGAAHRAHASTEGIAHLLPSFAGLLMYKEITELSSLLSRPAKPFVAIIGGSKVSSKISVIKNLIDKVDHILIGGGMTYTFLKSRAIPVGNSLVERDFEVEAFQLIERAGVAGVDFQLPVDHIIADKFDPKAKTKTVDKMGILDGWMGMDIGPKTVSNYEKVIKNASTIVWNGPMGVFEFDKFAEGTMAIAKAVSKSKAKTVVGGGDSIAAINKAKVEDKITHVSTGGGASLEFLEGKKLPGVQALLKQPE
ncbi:phosphoglycerate kinase [Leptospira fletcheri]|uniref:Phosphoglycerate kinase n=1 Tax=Leptospira fletcheri TaxID=2484981 RepID=A0A4R9GEK1_9LEPT|nr:phosphoglycerate kinase [Leptospira fletcheri]TGK09915.1 phosphoglycerate kinase [Leptospira fletcheri]